MKKQPALKTAVILAFGIIAGRAINGPHETILLLSSLCFLFCLLFYGLQKQVSHQALLVIAIFSIGLLRYEVQTRYFPKNHIIRFFSKGKKVTLQSHLIEDPIYKRNNTEFRAMATALIIEDTTYTVTGQVLVQLSGQPDRKLTYGDEIITFGFLEKARNRRNPAGFDYRSYLARNNIYLIFKQKKDSKIIETGRNKGCAFLRQIIYPARHYASQIIEETTSDPAQAVLKALLLGQKDKITPEIRDDFSKTGIIHILAVSGLHVGFILLIFMTFFGFLRIPYTGRVFLTLGGLIFYTCLTEAKIPVTRASIMAAVYLLSTLLERKTDSFNIIGTACVIILLFKPQSLFDIGFQLSFAAVISIVYFYHKLCRISFITRISQKAIKAPIIRYMLTTLLVSIAAQMGTLPLIVYYFNRLSVISILTNLIAIPVAFLAVALGFTSLLSFPLSSWISKLYATLNQELLYWFTKLINWMSSLPLSFITVPTPDSFTILAYIILLLLVFHYREPKRRRLFLFSLLLILNIITLKNIIWDDSVKLAWIQFDVGQGDAALLSLPRGKRILIDGGNKTPYYDNGKSVIAPYLYKKGIRKLDAVIMTHPHNDHIGGLIYIINHFTIGQVITTGTSIDSDHYRQFRDACSNKKIPIRIVAAIDSLIAFPGVKITFLSPPPTNNKNYPEYNINNMSLVTQVQFGSTNILFMGDAEKPVEKWLLSLKRSIQADAIKAGHHGSHTSSSQSFLEKVSPRFAVVSVGSNNRFHHPSPVIIQRYIQLGTDIHRTDLSGAALFSTDGSTLKKIAWH